MFRLPSLLLSAVSLLICVSGLAQERKSNEPDYAMMEKEALRVLTDSDYARTLIPSLQDSPCNLRNPAIPGGYPGDRPLLANEKVPPEPVSPDDSEYLIRFQSVKPVQTAIQLLRSLDSEWIDINDEHDVDPRPTDVNAAPPDYNEADMIGIQVILKRPGAGGTSFFDYAFEEEGHKFPSSGFYIWPCTGLKSESGQVYAHMMGFGHTSGVRSVLVFFPRLIKDKPIITKQHEKVEFRMVANQRVFAATFYVNASDVLDGSEKTLYLTSRFKVSKPNETASH